MSRQPFRQILSSVDGKKVTIQLELCFVGDSLTGLASDATGAVRDFSGWLGLVAAIDALVPSTPPSGPAAAIPSNDC